MRPEKMIFALLDTLAMMAVAYLLPFFAAFEVGLVGGSVVELWRGRNQPITIPTLHPLSKRQKWLSIGILLALWAVVWGLLFWMALTLTTYSRWFSLRFASVTAGYALGRVAIFAYRWMRQEEGV